MSALKTQLIGPGELATLLGVGKGWVYQRTQANASDPIPRCKGIGRLRFNPKDEAFKEWITRNFGNLDLEPSDE